ncbi:glycosyltransferase family 2 protein [Lutibacter sp.]|uniref:glycosyltransferase family 2 protein n=1 Tax=Lutibacter sp. TaxID=1925666 RepID=UPI0025BB6647|nr:glycosyltransferase family 2 protein [Lutibacter sp.]MCF6182667.1 glycosyltransferase [Lutibacter sp.]
MDKLVSIITPNFNCEKFIAATIKSVINQTYKNWELIIVDDCSTDNSVKIINDFISKGERIKLIKLNKNSGPAVARNKAIELSKGDYMAFLDSDDLWDSEKLEIQLNFMESKQIALSFTSYFSVNEEGVKLKMIEAKQKISYKNLLTNNYIGCLTAMYSVKQLGKVYFPNIKKRQDWALWLKITKSGVLAHGINKPLAYYTKRDFSVSSNKWDLLKYNWKIYREFENLSIVVSFYYFIQLFLKKIVK